VGPIVDADPAVAALPEGERLAAYEDYMRKVGG
jgi:hypothetical protein